MSPQQKKRRSIKPILILPTKQQIDAAREREEVVTQLLLERYGREHLNNSITEGEGMLAGLVGEEVFKDFYGFLAAFGKSIFHYDVLDLRHLGKIDVKTKRCTSEPKPNYNCTVSASNTEQRCDYYAFVRVLNDFSKAWILGLVPKVSFFEKALFFKRGAIDPAGFGGWRFKWDCFNLQIGDLLQPPESPLDFRTYEHRPAEHHNFTPAIPEEEENN